MEEWKQIAGFDGYEVSNLGRVRSYWTRRSGMGTTAHIIAQTIAKEKNYRRVAMQANGKSNTKSVHRLVLETFVGPCPDGMEACHADDDAANNALDNLRWDTKDANVQDKIANGRVPNGERHYAAMLTAEQVTEIRRRLTSEAKHGIGRKLAREFGVHPNTIYSIKDGLTWRNIDV